MLSNALYDRTSSVCRFLAVFLSVVLIIGLAPLPAYADPGYTAASTDGTVETTTGEGSQLAAEDASYVAKIGDTGYETLQAAVDAAEKGASITLLSNVTENITIGSDKDVTVDLNGKSVTNATGAHTVNVSAGKLTVQDSGEGGKIVSTNNCGICVTGGELTFVSGAVEAQEMALLLTYAGKATISGGSFTAKDNAVIGTNGSKGRGGNVLTITGGTFAGMIETSGYMACGVYVANDDTVNISGGTFNISGGVGIVARAGKVNLSGNVVINTTGSATGKVGDSRVVVPCSAILFDSSANYPGLTDESALTVSGGSYSSEVAVASVIGDAKYLTVSGGTFNKELDSSLLGSELSNIKLSDAEYIVGVAGAVARIGAKTYASLRAAVADAADGDTVQLLVNVTDSFTTGKNIALDLNGKKLTVSAAEGVQSTGGELAISNGTIESDEDDIISANGGTITLGTDLTATCSSSVLYAYNGGTIEIDGANVTSTSKNYAGSYATDSGSAIDVKNGTLAQTGANKVTLSIADGASALISGGKVTSDASTTIVAKGAGAVITVDGGTVETTANFVAGYAVNEGKIVVNDGAVNTSYWCALSAIRFGQPKSGVIEVTGGVVNKAVGAYEGADSKVVISGGTVGDASNWGVYVNDGATAEITDGTVYGFVARNKAADTITVSGGWFSKKVDSYGKFVAEGMYATDALTTAPNAEAPYTVLPLTKIDKPVAKAGLVCTGAEQTGVAAGNGYTLSGTTAAIEAGSYTATATLATGYAWSDGSTEPVTIDWSIAKAVAAIGNTPYASLRDAVDAAVDGDTVKMLDDEVLSEQVIINKNLTLDLDGKALTNEQDIWNTAKDAWSLVSVQGANVTIKGDGRIASKANDSYAADVRDGGSLSIESGEFVGNIHAVYVLKGSVAISGGTFSVQQKYPDASKADGFVINLYDANRKDGTATASITGGTFVGFDPSNNVAEGAGTDFTPEGYMSVDNGDGSYTVVESVTVAFDSDNGEAAVSQEIKKGDKVAKPADPEKSGYVFTGWFNDNNEFDFVTAISESVTLTAKWRLNTDELTEAITAAEAALEATKSGSDELMAGDKYATDEVKATFEEAIETAKDASKSEDLDPQGVRAAAEALKTAQDTFTDALKPVWGVSFNANGGTGALPGAVPVIDGDTLAKVDNPTRDEYNFAGWFLNDAEYDFNAPVTGNITLTAHWVEKEIAQIGETIYPSLAKAIAAANDGDTVKLIAEAREAGAVVAKNITIDLNGNHYIITDGKPVQITGTVTLVNRVQESGSIASASSSAINVLGSGSLTVTEGVQVSGSSEDGKARGISGADKARIKIEGGMVNGVMDGIAVWGEAEAEIAGGTVSATGGNSTGAQSFGSAKLTISGGAVTGAGTGAQTASTLVVTGGTISGVMGHGVYASDHGKATISGGVITSNGIDLKTDNGGTIEVSGGYFAHEINPVYCIDGLMPKDAPEASGQYVGMYTLTQAQVIIAFVNDDGTELAKQTVEYGATPEYEGTTPAKEATAEYTYTFAGWDKEIAAATADATYTATYTSTKRSYTITFQNEDGTELSAQTVEYGVVPSYAGTATPAKAADDRYTYTHDGWTPTIAAVTGDATYTATFTPQTRSYTVTFVDENGDTLSAAQYSYGTAAADIVQPAAPTKAQDERWVYDFSAWTPAIENVTGDATYTAAYRQTSRVYTVTWYDEDGTKVLGTSRVPAATMPEYAGATPTKAADAQYTYEFAGWDRGMSLVAGDTSYRATYRGTLNTYTVKFVDEDGAVLDTQEVAYGSTPVYGGPTPTKDATASKHFSFAGWDKPLASVTGEATYTATYSDAPNTFTVTWLNEDGSVLETDEAVEYGATPEYNGATPAKAADAQYSYTFAGWGDLGTVSGDASYTAKYTSALNSYTITFVGEDGNELDQQSVAYGSHPEYAGETPAKAADAQYTYTFAGWDPVVADVTGEATYVATFDAAVNSYLVTFADEDGTVLQASRVAYGETPAYAGATPTKAGTVESTFAFSGWSPAVEAVTGAAAYTAQYAESACTYAITYLNWDGSVWRIFPSEEYGSLTPVAPAPLREPTEQYSYVFAGWTPSVATSVSGAATYRALFDRIENTHTVTFLDEDGTVLQSSEVVHGAMPTVPADPAKAADDDYTYAFAGWDKEIVAADEDATYTATYTATLIDKVSLSVAAQTLTVGGTFKAPVDSATGDVTWSSSNPAIARVSSDGTVTAIASGSVVITARCGSASASYPVTVTAPASNTNNGSGGNSGSGSNSGSNASSGSGSSSGSSTSGGSSASSGSSSTRTSGSTSSGTTTTTRNVTNNYYTTNSTRTLAAAPAAATTAPTAADNDADDDADESDADGNGNASENSAAAAPTDPATAARNAAQAIVDDANPLDSGAAESIEEDENPLSSGLDSAMVQPDARQVTPWWIWAVAGAVAIGGLVLLIGKRRKNDEEEDERLRA